MNTTETNRWDVLIWAEGREGELGAASILHVDIPADATPEDVNAAVAARWDRASAYRRNAGTWKRVDRPS
jgi:hypothetical protein